MNLEYLGPLAGLPYWPPDPDSDEYIVVHSDPTAPALITLPPCRLPHPVPPATRLRLSRLPPLSPWPADDAPGRLTEAKAVWALVCIAQGYAHKEIGVALGLTRGPIWALAAGQRYPHLPRPAAGGP